MHEVSIALNLLQIASEQCSKQGFRKIEAINVRIGRASGIMPDALLFAFNALREGPMIGGAVLHIEEVPLTGLCADCGKTFPVAEEYILACPECGGNSFSMLTGRELDIVDMEVL